MICVIGHANPIREGLRLESHPIFGPRSLLASALILECSP